MRAWPGCTTNAGWMLAYRESVRRYFRRPSVPNDVRQLVIAARVVAFEDRSPEALKELDEASEAFADRVPWDDEPLTAEQQLNNLAVGLAEHDSDCSVQRGCGCDCGAHNFASNVAKE